MARAPKSPRETLNVKRLPKVGDRIMIEVPVTRVAQNSRGGWDITIEAPNGAKATTTAERLGFGDD